MLLDGLTCAFDHCAMGLSTERHNGGRVSRERQDAFSARQPRARGGRGRRTGGSPRRSSPVEVPQRKGDPLVVDTDEGVRPGTTAESLAALRPAFDPEGTITAGNASQISDGGAAVIVMSEARAARAGIAPLGELVAYGQVAGPDASLLSQPANAIAAALARPPSPSPTSTSSRSTRRSPPSGCSRPTSSASTSRGST